MEFGKYDLTGENGFVGVGHVFGFETHRTGQKGAKNQNETDEENKKFRQTVGAYKNMFLSLKLDVQEYWNMSYDKLEEKLDEISSTTPAEPNSCIFLLFLSHGDDKQKDSIVTRNAPYPMERIVGKMKNQNLNDIPKIIFFEACRGNTSTNVMQGPSGSARALVSAFEGGYVVDGYSAQGADTLVCYATSQAEPAYFLKYDYAVDGPNTFYSLTLTETVAEYLEQDVEADFVKLMTLVTYKLCERSILLLGDTSANYLKQTPTIVSTLRKQLVFKPGERRDEASSTSGQNPVGDDDDI